MAFILFNCSDCLFSVKFPEFPVNITPSVLAVLVEVTLESKRCSVINNDSSGIS